VERGLADGTTRAVVARNAIVLIGRRGAAPRTFETLDELPEGERIAIGDPASVPAGRYAKQALEALGSWEALAPRFVYGMDVAAVLAYVRRGEVAAGIVYRTETSGVEDVVVLDQARPPWAPTPEVVAAAVRDARQARDARDFLDFLQGPIARGILADHGFLPP
jgi:molybdate transport system substrate-binding protein